MMSCAWGRRSIGKTAANSSGSVSQPEATCGDSDDVAQVSMTSGSPTKPPGTPRCAPPTPGAPPPPEAAGGDTAAGAQGSMTSGSPTKPPGTPRCDSSNPGGTSDDGSSG